MQETASLEALLNPGSAGDFFQIDNPPAFDPAATNLYVRRNTLWLIPSWPCIPEPSSQLRT